MSTLNIWLIRINLLVWAVVIALFLSSCSPFNKSQERTAQGSGTGDSTSAGVTSTDMGGSAIYCVGFCVHFKTDNETDNTAVQNVEESVANVLKQVGNVNESQNALQVQLEGAKERESTLIETINNLQYQNEDLSRDMDGLRKLNRALYGDEDVSQDELKEIVQ